MGITYLISKAIKKIYVPAIKNSYINKTSKICSGSHIVESSLDRYSYIGNYCTVINSEIGRFCSIADNCIIGGASHTINWVSTSPVFNQGRNILRKNFARHEFKPTVRTVIGNDVWIGNNVLIKGGVNIKDGAVIGMGAVLTKDVGAYEIWAGNPAKFIRKRFSEETIEKLLEIKWWNLDDVELYEHAKSFNNLDEYLKTYIEEGQR